MSWLQWRGKTPQEELQENRASLLKAMREIERECCALEGQDRQGMAQVKQAAERGHAKAAKTLARDVVRTRAQIERYHGMRSQLRSVYTRMTELQTSVTMEKAFRGAVNVMAKMDAEAKKARRKGKAPAMAKVLAQYERLSREFEARTSAIGAATEPADEAEGAEEDKEADVIVCRVMDEIGLDTMGKLAAAPVDAAAVPQRARPAAEDRAQEDAAVDDLLSRIKQLGNT